MCDYSLNYNETFTVGAVHEPPVTYHLHQSFSGESCYSPTRGNVPKGQKVTPHSVGRWHEVPEGTDAVSVAVPARNRPYDEVCT